MKTNRVEYKAQVVQTKITPEQLLRWLGIERLGSKQQIFISVLTSCGEHGRYYYDSDGSILMDVEVKWAEETGKSEGTSTMGIHSPTVLIGSSAGRVE